MADRLNVRVRLDFTGLFCKAKFNSLPPLCWIFIDKTDTISIRKLKSLIQVRYGVRIDEFQLYLQEGLLPDDEPIELLRDDDLIRVVFDSKNTNDEGNEVSVVRSSVKRKHKQKSDVSSEVTTFDNLASQGDQKKKRKKQKKMQLEVPNKLTQHKLQTIFNSSNISDRQDESLDSITKTQSKKKSTKKKSSVGLLCDLFVNDAHTSENNMLGTGNSETLAAQNFKNSLKAGDIFPEPHLFDSPVSLGSLNDTISNPLNEVNSLSIDEKPVKKKRKRQRRKRQAAQETSTVLPLTTKVDSRTVEFISPPKGSHIRFEEKLNYRPTDNEKSSHESPVAEEKTDIGNSILQVDNSEITGSDNKYEDRFSFSSGKKDSFVSASESPYPRFKEFSKVKQINSVCTNKSLILLNCFGSYANGTSTPKESSDYEILEEKAVSNTVLHKPKSYEDYTKLNGPPRTGDHIAYKILELSDTYCPEVSDFKEGKVLNVTNDILEIQLMYRDRKQTHCGKFDLYYSDEERVEEWNDMVRVNWSDMIDTRLLNAPSKNAT